jgi:hypothetical protein
MINRRKCIIAVLLLLASTSVLAQPGPATLITPAADVVGTTVAFTWQSVPTATWYQFWLGRADTSLVMEQWYTAENVGCAGGGTCTLTLTPAIGTGAFIWHIRPWSAAGYGPWSGAHIFTMKEPVQTWSAIVPPSRRFTLVFDNTAVLDHETGLVWERTPSTTPMLWTASQSACYQLTRAGRRGWRVPTIAELSSLLDMLQAPALPPGHPFVFSGQPGTFWSSTSSIAAPDTQAVAVVFDSGIVGTGSKASTQLKVWCVRGGASDGN